MSNRGDTDLAGLDQVEDLLKAYADSRLSPTSPVLARMRAAVVAQAVAKATVAEQHRNAAERAARLRWVIPSLHVPRRAIALGLAASLTLGTTAAVLAAPPGSPFYRARVAIEAALLPNDADARLGSHEDHLNQRLAEAQAAAASGDSAALAAALDAYQAEVDAAIADLGDDADRLTRLEAALGNHVAVLQALAGRLTNETAAENALAHAIDASQKAVQKLQDKGSHAGGKPSQAPHPTRPPSTDGGGDAPDQTQGGQGNPAP